MSDAIEARAMEIHDRRHRAGYAHVCSDCRAEAVREQLAAEAAPRPPLHRRLADVLVDVLARGLDNMNRRRPQGGGQ